MTQSPLPPFKYDAMENGCWRARWGNIVMGCTLETDLENFLNRPIRILKQIHSDIIYDDASYQDHSQGDGLITDRTDIALVIKTADCTPVLVTDGQRLGAVHAGWRGAKAGIVERLEEYFQLQQCLAVIGPCISGDKYEVDKDLYQDWQAEDPSIQPYLKQVAPNSSKRLFNLKGFVQEKLQAMKTGQTALIPICTYQSGLPSYRRQGKGCPRIFHYIHHA